MNARFLCAAALLVTTHALSMDVSAVQEDAKPLTKEDRKLNQQLQKKQKEMFGIMKKIAEREVAEQMGQPELAEAKEKEQKPKTNLKRGREEKSAQDQMKGMSDKEVEARIFESSKLYGQNMANALSQDGIADEPILSDEQINEAAKVKAAEKLLRTKEEQKVDGYWKSEWQKSREQAKHARELLLMKQKAKKEEAQEYMQRAKEAAEWKQSLYAKKDQEVAEKAGETAAPAAQKPQEAHETASLRRQEQEKTQSLDKLLEGSTGGTAITFETETEKEAQVVEELRRKALHQVEQVAGTDELSQEIRAYEKPVAKTPVADKKTSLTRAREILEDPKSSASDKVLNSDDLSEIASNPGIAGAAMLKPQKEETMMDHMKDAMGVFTASVSDGKPLNPGKVFQNLLISQSPLAPMVAGAIPTPQKLLKSRLSFAEANDNVKKNPAMANWWRNFHEKEAASKN